MRRFVGRAAARVVVCCSLVIATSCGDGCGFDWLEYGEMPPPPGSAEALVGHYPTVEVRRGEGSCRVGPWRPAGRMVLAMGRARARDAGPERSEVEELDILWCREGTCSPPERRIRVRAGRGTSWSENRGEADVVAKSHPGRRCRLRTVRWKLVPDGGEVHLTKTVRGGTVALEGRSKCRAETAVARATTLPCRSRVTYRARRESNRE